MPFVVSPSNRERPLAAERLPFDPAAAVGLRVNEGTHVTLIAPRSTKSALPHTHSSPISRGPPGPR